ncbi:MAG: methionyl-tRNA formyltransferase [bacterium]
MRALFAGTGEIGAPSLKALARSPTIEILEIITQPDKPAGRHQQSLPPPIKQTACELGLPISQPENINDPVYLAKLKALQPDVIIVCAYGQILRQPILELPKHGCINIHASLLPKYRGAACIHAPILNGDATTGITIMQVIEKLDAGDILRQATVPIAPNETAGSLSQKLAQLAPQPLLQTLDDLQENRLAPQPQDETQASYLKKLSKQDGHINWQKTAEEIERHIRAMNPWPTAWTRLPDGKLLKIFTASLQPDTKGQAGEILETNPQGILIAAAKGSLLLQEIQLEGKKKMTAEEFLRGHSLTPKIILN